MKLENISVTPIDLGNEFAKAMTGGDFEEMERCLRVKGFSKYPEELPAVNSMVGVIHYGKRFITYGRHKVIVNQGFSDTSVVFLDKEKGLLFANIWWKYLYDRETYTWLPDEAAVLRRVKTDGVLSWPLR